MEIHVHHIFYHTRTVHTIIVEVQFLEEFIKVSVEYFVHCLLEEGDDPCSVRVLYEAVVVDPHHLMHPKTFQNGWLRYSRCLTQHNSYTQPYK